MSDREEGRDRRDPESDRIDALISAYLDGDLDDDSSAASLAELRQLIAEDPSIAARVRAFEQVDAELRGLAEADLDERLAANFAALTARLGTSAPAAPAAETSPSVVVWLRARALPLLVAAAAALAVYLGHSTVGPGPGPGPGNSGQPERDLGASPVRVAAGQNAVENPVDRTQTRGDSDLELAEELVWALGYVEDGGAPDLDPGALLDDLEIIDQLDVLDYLRLRELRLRDPNARDSGSRDREERG